MTADREQRLAEIRGNWAVITWPVRAIEDAAWLLAEVDRLTAERNRLESLCALCTCRGVQDPTCRPHGAVRELAEVQDRLRAVEEYVVQVLAAEGRPDGEAILRLLGLEEEVASS